MRKVGFLFPMRPITVGGFLILVERGIQQIWETKMMQAGAVLGPVDRSAAAAKPPPGGAAAPVHDLNVPYEGTEEYETPTADMLFPPVSSVPCPLTPCRLARFFFFKWLGSESCGCCRLIGISLRCRRLCKLPFQPRYLGLLIARCTTFRPDLLITLLLQMMVSAILAAILR